MKNIIMIALVAVMVFGVFALAVNALKTPQPVAYETYIVRSGDTLWQIAKQSDGWNNMDVREIIYDMQEASHCSATIQPGQVIYIPMYDLGGK